MLNSIGMASFGWGLDRSFVLAWRRAFAGGLAEPFNLAARRPRLRPTRAAALDWKTSAARPDIDTS